MLATYEARLDGRVILKGEMYGEFVAELLRLAPVGQVEITSGGRVVARYYDAQIVTY